MNYNEVPSLLKELQSLNLKPTVEDRYGKAIVIIEKDDYINETSKAVALITKQKKLKIIDFPQHIAIF